ncbi:PaaI family thioesterase [Desulfolucanica intricata]|uniref:PaaI family thioesterase n=1 Tax=Desulfolucanica intricata TaxID=1285191 RepID=UPI00083264E8|nr:PaaI family thioesterase [Desulfolucanica intricata]
MSVDLKDDSMCFACSTKNKSGLKMKFSHEGDVCRSTFVASREHEGWPGFMHGGLVTTLLDEVMSQWLWGREMAAMTAELNVRFIKPVPVGQPITIEGRMEFIKGRLIVLNGQVVLPDQTVAAKATGKFLRAEKMLKAGQKKI